MATDIAIGADVTRNGEALGSVERVLKDDRTGEIKAVLVRSGRADTLMRVPAHYLQPESESRVVLDPSVAMDELEREAIASGRVPPAGTQIKDAGPTAPSPAPEQVLGQTLGLPNTYDGPSTG